METKRRVVGLVGRAGAGKDTLADRLCATVQFNRRAFADPLRAAVKAITGWKDIMFTPEFKNKVDPFWGKSPRQFMQHLGQSMRLLQQDVWIKAFEAWLADQPVHIPLVVTDVRHPDEVECIRSLGGLIVNVRRGEADMQPVEHVSEEMAASFSNSTSWWSDAAFEACGGPVMVVRNIWPVRDNMTKVAEKVCAAVCK